MVAAGGFGGGVRRSEPAAGGPSGSRRIAGRRLRARIAAVEPFAPPAVGYRLVADYDKRSANYMLWFWERVPSEQLGLV